MGTLPLGPLTRRTVHLCVDMQRLFTPDGPWPNFWIERVLPVVTAIAERHCERTIFTRFVPPARPEQAHGAWRRYYERWREVTLDRLDPRLLELLPPLARLVPPAKVLDKKGYSAFTAPALRRQLAAWQADAVVVTGTETDVCVLATVMLAVEFGYRVVVVTDAICSSSDAGHDALLTLYRQRLSLQVEAATAEDVLRAWPA